jgi:hypothetical protein
MIYLKSINIPCMDEYVKQAVKDTPFYIEGCRRSVYTPKRMITTRQWVPVKDHLVEMDRSQSDLIGESDHPHSWTLFIPEESTMDFRHIHQMNALIRVYPMDGLLLLANEEHLFEFFVNNDSPSNVFTKKYS